MSALASAFVAAVAEIALGAGISDDDGSFFDDG